MKKRNYLVTGGTGLLGAHLLAHLVLSSQYEVSALRRKSSKMDVVKYIFGFYTNDIHAFMQQIHWVEGNVLDKESLLSAMQDMQVVYHCAADVLIGDASGSKLLETNVKGTQNVVEAALQQKLETLCFVSSVAAIGKVPSGDFADELTPWDSERAYSAYAQSKYDAEKVVLSVNPDVMRVVIVNPGVILGAYNKSQGSSAIIYLAKKGLPFYIQGGGAYVDVRDVCRAMLLLVDSNVTHERFILVGANTTTRQLLSHFARSFGKIKPVFPLYKPFVLSIAFVAECVSKLLHNSSNLNRKAVKVAFNTSYYSAEKIQKHFAFRFTTIEKTAQDISTYLKN